MPINNTLTPLEASYIATNSYFALKDWIIGNPIIGVETRANVQNMVLGAGNVNGSTSQRTNTSLQSTDLRRSGLKGVLKGTTGLSTTSGFGYVLECRKDVRCHTVIATRGTRPELGAPDLLTDLRAGMTGFTGYGPVHKGFKKTFDSVLVSLAGDQEAIMASDVVHCVGHSLGGAVATLVAAHYARLGKKVKLYTFGSPRVGAALTYSAMHRSIGKENIYRTAHDLDPITLIAPFPYIHVNPSPGDDNNFTLPSPTGSLFSTTNHEMDHYIKSVGADPKDTWENARGYANRVDHDNSVLARWLLHKDNDPGWVRYASAKTLGLLFKLFAHVLKTTSTSIILSLSAIDLLAEMLLNNLYRKAALAGQVYRLLCYVAKWAGIHLTEGAEFTAQIIRRILETMLRHLKSMALHALVRTGRDMAPLPLIMAGGWALASSMAL